MTYRTSPVVSLEVHPIHGENRRYEWSRRYPSYQGNVWTLEAHLAALAPCLTDQDARYAAHDVINALSRERECVRFRAIEQPDGSWKIECIGSFARPAPRDSDYAGPIFIGGGRPKKVPVA